MRRVIGRALSAPPRRSLSSSNPTAASKVKVVAGSAPIKVDVEAGKTYSWCTCGRSTKQPFCDGSHKGTGMQSLKFVADKTESLFLCTCKATNNAPRCDGSHKVAEEIRSLVKAHDIVVFTKTTCPYCEKAKDALKAAGKDFHYQVVTAEQQAALGVLTGQKSVPNIWVKGNFVGGCNDGPEPWMGITKLLGNGELDKLLHS